MANKVDVFTEELSKVFTILQQQYVMIKYMKALITSGELDETEINKLKEQVTLMNNKLNRIIDDELVTIKQSILRIEQGMGAFEKIMPTDINVDSNGNLILEHDGTEITGQKKQVAVYTKSQIDTLINSAGLKTFTLNNEDDYQYQDNGTFGINVTTTDIEILNNAIEYVRDSGPCILEFDYINRNLGYDSKVRILLLYTIDDGMGHYIASGTNGNYYVRSVCTRNEGASADENKISFYELAEKNDIKDYKVIRHQLTLTNTNNVSVNCNIYSSNNLKIDSVQDFVTVVKPNADYEEQAIYLDNGNIKTAYIRYSAGAVIIQLSNGGLYPVKTITDIVTTI